MHDFTCTSAKDMYYEDIAMYTELTLEEVKKQLWKRKVHNM